MANRTRRTKIPYTLSADAPAKLLDVVALSRDLPQYGLAEGDIGTIVEVYGENEAFEVEFGTDGGYLVALLTMTASDFRPPSKAELARWPREGLDASEHLGSTI